MFRQTTEAMYFVYLVQNAANGEDINKVTFKLDSSGMTMFELTEEFARFLRAVGYPLDFGDKLEVIKEERAFEGKKCTCAEVCCNNDIDYIGDDLEEIPK